MKKNFKRTAALLLAVCIVALVMAVIALVHFGHQRLALAGLAVLPFLGTLSFYTDLRQYSFAENVTDALVGKEGQPVELVTGTLNIQLYNNGIAIGVMFERLEGSQAIKVHLRGPITKGVATGAINAPAYVKYANGGIVAASSGDKAYGIAIYPYVAATNDVVSFIQTDCIMP